MTRQVARRIRRATHRGNDQLRLAALWKHAHGFLPTCDAKQIWRPLQPRRATRRGIAALQWERARGHATAQRQGRAINYCALSLVLSLSLSPQQLHMYERSCGDGGLSLMASQNVSLMETCIHTLVVSSIFESWYLRQVRWRGVAWGGTNGTLRISCDVVTFCGRSAVFFYLQAQLPFSHRLGGNSSCECQGFWSQESIMQSGLQLVLD